MRSSTTWRGRTMVTAQAWKGRSENSIDVARTHWQPSDNAQRTPCNLSRPRHACTTSMKSLLGFSYVVSTSMPSLLRPKFLLRPDSTTSSLRFLNMSKVRPRPPRPWRPYHVLIGFYCFPTTLYKVLTASTQFLKDVVRTWLVWRGLSWYS